MSTVNLSVLSDITSAVISNSDNVNNGTDSGVRKVVKERVALHKQSQVLVLNVFQALKMKKPEASTNSLINETSDMTNVGKTTVRKIVTGGKLQSF